MKEKLINDLNNTKNATHVIRIIGCGYVAVTCGKVVLAYFDKGGVSLALMLCASVLTLIALGIAVISLWATAKGYCVEYKGKAPWTSAGADEEGAEEATEEDASEENTAGFPAEEVSEAENGK